MYIYIYVYMYIYVFYTCTYINMYIYTYVYIYICIDIYTERERESERYIVRLQVCLYVHACVFRSPLTPLPHLLSPSLSLSCLFSRSLSIVTRLTLSMYVPPPHPSPSHTHTCTNRRSSGNSGAVTQCASNGGAARQLRHRPARCCSLAARLLPLHLHTHTREPP